MSQAKAGDKVKVHYTGKLEDGTVFDSSKEREPLEFDLGSGNVIPGFENGILGMEVGESKTLTIVPDEAYGQTNSDLVATVERKQFPENITPELGLQLQMSQPNGQPLNVTVINIVGDSITLDANHPLAGKTLVFDIELVAVA
ncbi:MAG: peptidylprolyl isomerase [bacterium]|nr:peptidylprolyl isomerase [bacterium]